MTSEREYDVWGVRFDDKSGWPIIVLKDAENGQCFGIAISALNVYPVLVVTDPQKWPDCGGRPVTQDFALALARAGDLRIERLVIDRLTEEGVFTAAVEVRSPGGETSRLDARPSDAIPVAVGAGAPIFVADDVIVKVRSFPPEELPYREIKPEDVPGLEHRD
jgi:bifunctional DNase/RNase